MTGIRRARRLPATVALAALAACASTPAAGDACPFTTPSVAGWATYDEGAFTIRLPAEYRRVQVQGIDSQVGRWTSAGGSVGYDLGRYSNPLRPHDPSAFPEMVVCQEGDGRGEPRIVSYRPTDGGYAVSAHWPDVRREGPGMTVSLTIDGVVQAPGDRGEILAILRTVRVEPR